jgi:hypothetical protein
MPTAHIMAKWLGFAKLVVFLCVLGACVDAHAWSEVICAGDVPPEGLVVTATGTAPSCNGACRARKVQPVFGEIMKICADQPIPKGYVLDGITATPACRCLGTEENAYIIKRRPLNYTYGYDETLSPTPNETFGPGQMPPLAAPGYPYQYPYPNQNQNQTPPYNTFGAFGGQQPPPAAPPPAYTTNNPPAPGMMGNYPPYYYPYCPYCYQPYEQEPMRIGE